MALRQIINSVGLALDIVGVLLLWKFGLPKSISRSGAVNRILEQADESEIALGKKYDRCAKVAIACLLLGFALQLLSNFL